MTTYKKISDLDVSTTIANTDLFIMETLTGTKSVTVETFRNSSQVTKETIGLGNVDNTSDLNKPISTATQTALDAKLSTATAASTYLTQTDAASTYLTQNTAAGTYLSKTDAANAYLTKSDASTTYGTKTEVNAKQDTLVSGTNIKTINNNSVLGEGNITIDSLPAQSGQSGKFLTTNGTNASWDVVDLSSKQDILVSGTNIKTINSNSILGSGNLEIDALPTQAEHSGQFLTTNGSAASWATITVPTKISDLTDDTATNPIDKADTLTDLTATITELNYCDGVTSAIQTQIDAKQTTSNLVTSISASSTDAQYPSAKCMYDMIGNIETLLSQV